MQPELIPHLSNLLLCMADDELILGHRNSEWCGHAPILEEDIAFANLALDEIGHAGVWYALLAELAGEDVETYPDKLVFFRDPPGFRSLQMVELPPGDWAFSILRQYLFDALEMVRLKRLSRSAYRPMAEAAAKIRKEEIYHFRHSQAWIKRLGLGTQESNRRLQKALDGLWPYTLQPFTPLPGEAELAQAGLAPASGELGAAWEALVFPGLRQCELSLPDAPRLALSRQEHTPHLKVLLAEMQSLARSEPQAEW